MCVCACARVRVKVVMWSYLCVGVSGEEGTGHYLCLRGGRERLLAEDEQGHVGAALPHPTFPSRPWPPIRTGRRSAHDCF